MQQSVLSTLSSVTMETNINNDMTKKKKTSKGRQKVEIKKIEKTTSLQTCFSKRKHGVFNKAAELSVLCGADVAVIVKAPSGRKFYSFGSPSTDYVFDRFLYPIPNANVENVTSNDRIMQLTERNRELEAERDALERGERSDDIGPYWWEEDISRLGLCELEKFVSALEVLQSNVMGKAHQMGQIEGYYSSLVSN